MSANASGKALSEYTTMPKENTAIPCGLIAKATFNDTFEIKMCSKGNQCPEVFTEAVTMNEKGIAWSSDVQYKYNNTKKVNGTQMWDDIQWMDMTDEHFMVWMRTSALPNFRKLYGRVEGGLKEGARYQILIKNNYNVANFQGKKSIVLTTLNSLGGNNTYFAILYLIGAIVTFVFMLVSIYATIKYPDGAKKTDESANNGDYTPINN
jgi:hypothetical protein